MKPIAAGLQRWVEIDIVTIILDVGRRRHPAGRRSLPAGNSVPIPLPIPAGPA